MPIVIKEINVTATVEKKTVLPAEIPESVYARLKEELLEELAGRNSRSVPERTKKER